MPPLTRYNGKGGFLASASVISLFSLLGVVTGFAVNASIAAKYGVSAKVDAFFVAYTLPAIIQGLARASCTTVLIPAFSRCSVSESDRETRRFLSVLVSAGLVIGAVLGLVGIIGSSLFVRLLAPGSSLEVQATAGELAQILFGTAFLTWVVSVLRAFLYSQQFVAVPSALDAIQRIIVIVVFLAVERYVGIVSIAYGYVLGTIAQLLVEVVVLVERWGLRYLYFGLNFSLHDIQAAQQVSFSLGSSLLGQAGLVVDRIVASFLPEGSIAVLGYARQLMEIVIQVFLGSAPLALLPSLAASMARNVEDEVRNKLSTLLSFMSGISIPLAGYLILLSTPLVHILFRRGSFDQEATRLTASTLSVYALGVLFVGYFRAVEFYLYADTKAGRVLSLFCLFGTSTVGFDIILVRLLGIRGIALAYSIALVLSLVLGFMFLYNSLPVTTWRRLLMFNIKMVGACAITFLTSSSLVNMFRATSSLSGTVEQLVIVAVVTIMYLVTLIIVLKILQLKEFDVVPMIVARRILRR